MNELIKVNYENVDRPTVSGRELWEALEVKTDYPHWFERMTEYGFSGGKDYQTFLSDRVDGKAGKPRTDHQLTIPMAKELCMLQRTDKGKQMRQYTREEFVRHALAYPCVAEGVPESEVQLGIVRLRVTDWETPHARPAENAGRLYRGLFLDRPLEIGMEIELEADLLGVCSP